MKDEIKNGIIISICVILILVVVYLTTAVFLTGEIGSSKKSSTSTSEETTASDSSTSETSYDNMIIAGKTFSQSEDSYMVLFFSKKEASDSLKNTISSYDSGSNDTKLYKVNIDETINKYVKSDTDNTTPTSSSDLKISGSALITITSGEVSSYITDETQIINALK
jgi:flagellar basal body-associated protein FliL